MGPELFETMRSAWLEVAARFEAYRLVLPGSPQFICQPDVCTAYCCHAYSVGMSEADVERMRRFERLEPVDFLELDENRQPIALPLAHPYLLARSENRCKLLRQDLSCGAYDGRPNACRLYPHFVVFWDSEAGRVLTTPSPDCQAAFDTLLGGGDPHPLPLLLGHSECPGFTGPPLSSAHWDAIFRQTYQLQYAAL